MPGLLFKLYSTSSIEKFKQFCKLFLVCYVCSKHHASGEETEVKETCCLPSRSLLFSGEINTDIIYSTAHQCFNKDRGRVDSDSTEA